MLERDAWITWDLGWVEDPARGRENKYAEKGAVWQNEIER